MFGLHYLDKKPVYEFKHGEAKVWYTRLLRAEREGLIRITLSTPTVRNENGEEAIDIEEFLKPAGSSSVPRLLELFLPSSEPDSEIREDWDRQRRAVVKEMLLDIAIPAALKELHRDLLRDAKEAIMQQAADKYCKLINVAPFRKKSLSLEHLLQKRQDPVSVLSIVVSPSPKDSTVMAFVDESGVLRRHDLVPSTVKGQLNERIEIMMKSCRPTLILINTSGLNVCRAMKARVQKSIVPRVDEDIRRDAEARRNERLERIRANNPDFEEMDLDDDDVDEPAAKVQSLSGMINDVSNRAERVIEHQRETCSEIAYNDIKIPIASFFPYELLLAN